ATSRAPALYIRPTEDVRRIVQAYTVAKLLPPVVNPSPHRRTPLQGPRSVRADEGVWGRRCHGQTPERLLDEVHSAGASGVSSRRARESMSQEGWAHPAGAQPLGGHQPPPPQRRCA